MCAIREVCCRILQTYFMCMLSVYQVQEETGFDLTKLIKDGHSINMTIREQSVTLFIVGGVPDDYPFQCRTRKEISVRLLQLDFMLATHCYHVRKYNGLSFLICLHGREINT